MADDSSAGADAMVSGIPVELSPDRKANLDAMHHPPASADDPAGVELAGGFFTVWVTPDQKYRISVDLGEVAAWMRQPDGTVPVRLTDGAEILFAAGVCPPDPPSSRDTGRRGDLIPLARGRARRRTTRRPR